MSKKGPKRAVCNFCGKPATPKRRLIGGRGAYICEECVGLCTEIVGEHSPSDARDSGNALKQGLTVCNTCGSARADVAEVEAEATPRRQPAFTAPSSYHNCGPSTLAIKRALDAYVVGQESAKRALAVAVHNHHKRIDAGDGEAVELDKSNVLLLGPTGTGKTLLVKTLARALDLPLAIADATTLTEAGYVGEDVESVLVALLRASDFDLQRAERGIVYIDEIDKLARAGKGRSLHRDVSGEGVQQGLLKMLEGTVCNVPLRGGRKNPQQDYTAFDTTEVLFICGGAFEGLADIVAQRLRTRRIGFGAPEAQDQPTTAELLAEVRPDDLIAFGLIPEFVGRLPMVVPFEELDEDALLRILTEPRNALVCQYQFLLAQDGVKLRFAEDALRAIASKAKRSGSGARGLRACLERLLADLQFNAGCGQAPPSVLVDEKFIVSGGRLQSAPPPRLRATGAP